jgi:hypothetical protein
MRWHSVRMGDLRRVPSAVVALCQAELAAGDQAPGFTALGQWKNDLRRRLGGWADIRRTRPGLIAGAEGRVAGAAGGPPGRMDRRSAPAGAGARPRAAAA